LLLLILFATLVPAMFGVLKFLERRDAEIAMARRALATSAQRGGLALSDTVRATAQLQFGLSRARDLDTQDRAGCSLFLADVLKEHPQYTGLVTIKPDGSMFCDSLRTGRTLNLANRRYFQEALRPGNPLAVEPVFGQLTGRAVLQIAYGVRRADGEPDYVLLASLDLDKYMQSYAKFLLRDTVVIALMDSRGTVLTWHPGGEKPPDTSLASSPLSEFARQHNGGAAREIVEADGSSRIWAAGALPGFPQAGLYVLVGVSEQELLALAAAPARKTGGWWCSCATTAWASTCSMRTSCSGCSSGCTASTNSRAPASGWPPCGASSPVTAAGHGPKASLGRAPPSISRSGRRMAHVQGGTHEATQTHPADRRQRQRRGVGAARLGRAQPRK
jgi:hypothetical protein